MNILISRSSILRVQLTKPFQILR